MMKPLTVLALLIAASTALPNAVEDVVPEEMLFESSALTSTSWDEAKMQLDELRSNGKSDKDCRELADDTEDAVKSSVSAQQKVLETKDKGQKCPLEGQDAVKAAKKNLDDATAAKKKTAGALNKALNRKINFGDYTYNTLTEGKCGTFFNKQVWQSAKAAAKAAKSKDQQAAGVVTASQKSYTQAVAAAKVKVSKCQCKVKKEHKVMIKQMNDKAKAANLKAWTKAAHLRCILDGTPIGSCKVTALPVVQPVKLTPGTEANKCHELPMWANTPNGQYFCNKAQSGGYVGFTSGKNLNYKSWLLINDFDASCSRKYGAGVHMCTRAEIDAIPTNGKTFQTMKQLGEYVLASCGKYLPGSYWLLSCKRRCMRTGKLALGGQAGGYKGGTFYCKNDQEWARWNGGQQAGTWRNACKGQKIPCCR